MNSQWSDNLRKRMEAHDAPSPDGLWEDIEQIVTKKLPFRTVGQIAQSPSGQKKKLLWTKRIGAVAAILVVLLLVGDFFLKEHTPHSPAITQRPEGEHKSGNNLSPDHDIEEILLTQKGNHESFPDNNMVTSTTSVSTASTDREMDNLFIEREEGEPHSGDLLERPEEESDREGKVTDRDTMSRDHHHDYPISEPNTHYPIVTRRNQSVRWQTSLYASNTSVGSSKTYNGYRSFLSEEVAVGKDDMVPLLVKNPHEGIVAANKESTVHTETKHKQPVTVGASIKYKLDEKWSLTSGLTYTLLSSQLRSGSGSHYYISEQTLHNIGIPLNIHYNLWKGRDVSVYVSGGGMAEKNVSGKLSTDYIVNDKLESTGKDNISIDQLQWSLNTLVGIEYNLFPKIGLYAEPGVIYYFRNRSEVETIYKEKPVNINLRVGLRFSLGE
ncbi:outer membrane beta-barrel protein [Proteiniphilum sp.]|nr:outer membrane beta-barrel protein [Proteiniphilum sp.]MEA4918875.1 outer membrane beta-barrel protein [Proteiniphilum sp.]